MMLSQTRTLLIFEMKKNFAMPSKAEVGQRCLETYYSVTPTAMYYLRIRPLSLFFLLGLCAR